MRLGLTFACLHALKPPMINVFVANTPAVVVPSTTRSATTNSAGFLECTALRARQPLRQQPMIRGLAQSAARSRNPAGSVVALLVVLGTRSVEALAMEMWSTGGLKAWRPANVSPSRMACTQLPNNDCWACAFL